MAFYGKTNFSAAFFSNLGRAMLYQVIYVPLAFVYDVCSVAISWGICWLLFSGFGSLGFLAVLFGLIVGITCEICFQALKLSIVASWMPAVICEKKVVPAFQKSLSNGRRFAARFGNFLVAIYLIVVANVLCFIATLGSAVIITVPASFLLLVCLQLVCYYEDNGKKYYLNAHRVVGEEDELPMDAEI